MSCGACEVKKRWIQDKYKRVLLNPSLKALLWFIRCVLLVTCYHKYLTSGQTCTWAGSSVLLLQTLAAALLFSSTWSTENNNNNTYDACLCWWGTNRDWEPVKGLNLIVAPQQVVGLIADAGANKVHAVVLYSEVEISKPEHQPGHKHGGK